MAIDLVEKFLPYVDEQFSTESKKSLLTNTDFSWNGAHTIKVYKITTAPMSDYDRKGAKSATQWSRYGAVADLDATTEEFTLTKDRSFTFAIDKLDTDETASSLRRRLRWPGRIGKSVFLRLIPMYTVSCAPMREVSPMPKP